MRKLLPFLIIASIVIVVSSCSTTYHKGCIDIPNQPCKKINAGNVGGTTLGHHTDEDTVEKNNR